MIDKDIKNLDPIMQKALGMLAQKYQFKIVEGFRSPARQAELVKAGKSKTLRSKHLSGLAVDIFPLPNGYETNKSEWLAMHKEFNSIVTKLGRNPEPIIDWDLTHFGILQ